MNEQVTSGIIGLIAGVIIGLVTARLQHNLELDRIYLAPFRKWCADFYDELYEFERRYLDSQAQSTKYSNIQVIDDWRSLHDILAYATGWLARIQKEDKKLYCQLETLVREIDEFWHGLETQHQFVLRDRKDIIGLGLVKQNKIANALDNKRIYLLQTKEHKNSIDKVLKYLRKKIPSENIPVRLCKWIWRP